MPLQNFAELENGQNDIRSTSLEAKRLCSEFCFHRNVPVPQFDGSKLEVLDSCEKLFKIGIYTIGMEFTGANKQQRFFTIRAANAFKTRKMSLLLHDNHFMLIRNIHRWVDSTNVRAATTFPIESIIITGMSRHSPTRNKWPTNRNFSTETNALICKKHG